MTAKHPITRTRPGFQLFTPPVPGAGNSIYSNPNVRIMACQQLDQWALGNRQFPGTPVHFDRSGPGFFYREYTDPEIEARAGFVEVNARLVARRIAEAFEYQGFLRGTGSGPGGDYEGSVCVIGVGDTARNQPYTGVPTLLTYAMDAVAGPTDSNQNTGAQGANCWYNARGVDAVALWVHEFLAILKDELDNPDGGQPLCYPAHFAFDLEYDLPLVWFAINQVDYDEEEAETIYLTKPGWWAWALADDRYTTEDLLDPAQTAQTKLDQIVTGAPSYTSASVWSASANQAFSSWFTGITTSIVSYAMQRAIYAVVKDIFGDEVRVSNYGTYLADNRPRWNPGPNDWMQSNVPYLNADSQAPDLYGTNQAEPPSGRRLAGEPADCFWRRANIQAIEAMAYSTRRFPITPWIQAPGSSVRGFAPDADGEHGDFRWMLRNLARHGVHEFLLFADANATSDQLTAMSRQVELHCASVYPGRPRRSRWFWRS